MIPIIISKFNYLYHNQQTGLVENQSLDVAAIKMSVVK